MCKRIRGLEGDVIYYRDKNRIPTFLKVPDGHVWLLGDNASNSNDSRYYGPVPIGLLLGRVVVKIGENPLHISFIDTITERNSIQQNVVKETENIQNEVKGDSGKSSRNLTKEFPSQHDGVVALQKEAIDNEIAEKTKVSSEQQDKA